MIRPIQKRFLTTSLIISIIVSFISLIPMSGHASKIEAVYPRALILGHRGAAGLRPEHTLASYEVAARLGADYIEPDLVATKDGVLVARHENNITETTDVAEHAEFANRKTTKMIDGMKTEGWFTEDFTLDELKQLRAKERLPAIRQHNTIYDKRYSIPTFQEVIDLSRRLSKELRRPIGIIPELKHPTYFKQIGLDLTPIIVEQLKRIGATGPGNRLYIQSFEVANLKEIHRLLPDVRLVQLVFKMGQPYDFAVSGDKRTYADLLTPEGLAQVAEYATVLSPEKTQIIPTNEDASLGAPTSLVSDAHRAGLLVMPYTFRPENQFLPAYWQLNKNPSDYGRLIDEIQQYLQAGIDGFFTDNPDIGYEARETFNKNQPDTLKH